MTLTPAELGRLVAMTTALRPDWPSSSVRTILQRDHGQRAYQDVAVALVVVACDPATRTPARLAEHGPWWLAAQAGSGAGADATPTPPRPGEWCPEHIGQPAWNCGPCRADELGGTGPSDPPTIPADQAATNHTGAATVRAAIRHEGVIP